MTTDNKSAYLTAGEYAATIVAVRLVNSKKSSDDFFVVELTVTEARGENAQPVGTEAAWVCKMGGQHPESALRDINGFLRAVTGAADADIDAQFVEDVIKDDGLALVDMPVRVTVTEKPTKRGGVFSKHTFRAPLAAGEQVPF
tara:strand:- start:1460 stop:1888 length:429 start_codon:yes stop_codon:yes gene_type:complete